jgi:hypothetical protein
MGDDEHPGERLLSASAHGLRNHVATIRSVVQLVDDAEVAEALTDAANAVQVAIERAVVLARVELGERPDDVELTVAQLLDLAARRARREGASEVHGGSGPAEHATVSVPGPWAERLVADLLHHDGAGLTGLSFVGERTVSIQVPLLDPVESPLDAALVRLASACGGRLEFDDGFARLELPLSAG